MKDQDLERGIANAQDVCEGGPAHRQKDRVDGSDRAGQPTHRGGKALHAVAAAAECWFILDRAWKIISCGDDVPGVVAQSVGMNVWDAFPGAEDVFGSIYAAGWERGQSSGIAFHNDTFTQIHTLRRGAELIVSFDFISVNGLRAAVEAFSSHLQRPTGDAQSLRPPLRLVQG